MVNFCQSRVCVCGGGCKCLCAGKCNCKSEKCAMVCKLHVQVLKKFSFLKKLGGGREFRAAPVRGRISIQGKCICIGKGLVQGAAAISLPTGFQTACDCAWPGPALWPPASCHSLGANCLAEKSPGLGKNSFSSFMLRFALNPIRSKGKHSCNTPIHINEEEEYTDYCFSTNSV